MVFGNRDQQRRVRNGVYADKLKEAGITVVEEANIFIDVYSLGDSGGKSYVSRYYTVYPTDLDAKRSPTEQTPCR